MFGLVDWVWHLCLLAGYVGMSWVAAIALRSTAPVTCPWGSSNAVCRESHPLHMNRQNAAWAAALGFGWPVAVLFLMMKGYSKSVEKTSEAVVPMRRVKTDKMLEAADKDFEEIKAETDSRMDRIIHEGRVVDDG